MKATVDEILAAKEDAGADAHLWVHASGDVILWPDEESSKNDAGANAIGRWSVNDATVDALIDSGMVDEVAWRLTRDRARAIVNAEFASAGWAAIGSPVVSEDEHGHLVLADGHYYEPLSRTEEGLREQCRAWAKSFDKEEAWQGKLF